MALTRRGAATAVAAALCALALWPGGATACGADTPCEVVGGSYRIRLPAAAGDGAPVGAVMYFHGWKASAAGVMANRGLERTVSGLGLALIAPDGAGGTWSYPGAPGRHRDEFRFVEHVLDDVAARFPVEMSRVMATGFSMGGSMVWNLACRMGDRFSGFAPVAGAFWEPIPERCPSPMPRLVHVHGLADRVVPWEGRVLGGGFRQGNTGRAIDVWLAQGGCPLRGPARDTMRTVTAEPARTGSPALDCSRSYACGDGVIELCLHDGAHILRPEWVARSWRRLEEMAASR